MVSAKCHVGAGERAQWLRLQAALPDNQDLIPSAHMVAQKHLQLQFQGIQLLLPASIDTEGMGCTDIHWGQNNYTHKDKIEKPYVDGNE